jgi:hypothetical protein
MPRCSAWPFEQQPSTHLPEHRGTPGRVTRMVIQAIGVGTFRGQCPEYCGAQHSLMAFEVIALRRAEFDSCLTGSRSRVGSLLHQNSARPRSLHESRLRRMPHRAWRCREPSRTRPHAGGNASPDWSRPASRQHRQHCGLGRKLPAPQTRKRDAVLRSARSHQLGSLSATSGLQMSRC